MKMSYRGKVIGGLVVAAAAAGCVSVAYKPLRDHGSNHGRTAESSPDYFNSDPTQDFTGEELTRRRPSDTVNVKQILEHIGKDDPKEKKEVELSSYGADRQTKKIIQRPMLVDEAADGKEQYLSLENVKSDYAVVVYRENGENKQVCFKTSDLEVDDAGRLKVYLDDLHVRDFGNLRMGVNVVFYKPAEPATAPVANPSPQTAPQAALAEVNLPAVQVPAQQPSPVQFAPVSEGSAPTGQVVGGNPEVSGAVKTNYADTNEARRERFRTEIRAQRDRMVLILSEGSKHAEQTFQNYIQRDDDRTVRDVVDEVSKGVDALRNRVNSVNADVDAGFADVQAQETKRDQNIQSASARQRAEILVEKPKAAEQPKEGGK